MKIQNHTDVKLKRENIQGVPKKIVILLNIASFFSWNTPKFSSCPVDAENGFKLDNRINMKEDMYILVSKKSLIFSQFLPFKLYFPQIWNMNFFEKLFYSTITYEKPS